MSKKKIKRRKSFFVWFLNSVLLVVLLSAGLASAVYVANTVRNGKDNILTRLIKRQNYSSLPAKAPTAITVPILIYHYVEYVQDPGDTIRKSLDILPQTFETQVKTLQDAGFSFLTPSYISGVLEGKKILPKKPVI